MADDARQQTFGLVEQSDKKKADRDGVKDLKKIRQQFHTAAVEQIEDMRHTECHTGNDDRPFRVIFFQRFKDETSGDDLL